MAAAEEAEAGDERGLDVEIRRDELGSTRVVDGPVAEPSAGQVLLRIDRFGLSTNNITFGVTGELLGYWKLFPSVDVAWGRVPVFGYADVVDSRHPDVVEGARLFGYLPMSRFLLVEPAKVDARGFLDGAAHRRDAMATVWNHYQQVPSSGVSAIDEARRSLLRPLFITGYLIADFIVDNDGFGADTVVIASASAKTAIATAHCLRAQRGPRVVGLTSPAHVAFVEGLGVFDEVLTYDRSTEVPAERAVFVDIAGRVDARDAVHARFSDRLAHSMTVGLSNVPDTARLAAPPPTEGPSPQTFFAQLQVAKRAAELGREAFDGLLDAEWERFAAATGTWLTIRTGAGPDDVVAAWLALLAGDVDPATGYDLTVWEA